jgi:hypothetical protein
MSGPIVRKYGFPNFDKIFGKRPLEHGVDEPGDPREEPKAPAKKDKPKRKAASEPKASKPKK